MYGSRVQWNPDKQAVEVFIIYDTQNDIEHLNFLNLPQGVRDLLSLEYTQDGYVLSASGIATSMEHWLSMAKSVGVDVVSVRQNDAIVRFAQPADPDRARARIEYDDEGLYAPVLGDRHFQPFAKRLMAERFLLRLHKGENGLYFMDVEDDQKCQKLKASGDRSKIQKALVSKGYGDMAWSIGINPDGDEDGDTDDFYFDFYELPAPFTSWAVQCCIDCRSGSFVQDWDADVVTGDRVWQYLSGYVSQSLDWYAENIPSSEAIANVTKQAENVIVHIKKSLERKGLPT